MNLKIFNNLVVGAIVALALNPEFGFAQAYLGVQGGYANTKLTTKQLYEIDKSGVNKFGKISIGSKYGTTKIGLDLSLGLGMNYAELKGWSDELQRQQLVAASFPFVDLTALVYAWPGLLIGGVMRNTYALGATYGLADANKMSYILAAGPSAFLSLPIGPLNCLAGAIYLTDINNPQRQVKSLYYSVGINYSFKGGSKAGQGPKK